MVVIRTILRLGPLRAEPEDSRASDLLTSCSQKGSDVSRTAQGKLLSKDMGSAVAEVQDDPVKAPEHELLHRIHPIFNKGAGHVCLPGQSSAEGGSFGRLATDKGHLVSTHHKTDPQFS